MVEVIKSKKRSSAKLVERDHVLSISVGTRVGVAFARAYFSCYLLRVNLTCRTKIDILFL